jgi:hypothetical protein
MITLKIQTDDGCVLNRRTTSDHREYEKMKRELSEMMNRWHGVIGFENVKLVEEGTL